MKVPARSRSRERPSPPVRASSRRAVAIFFGILVGLSFFATNAPVRGQAGLKNKVAALLNAAEPDLAAFEGEFFNKNLKNPDLVKKLGARVRALLEFQKANTGDRDLNTAIDRATRLWWKLRDQLMIEARGEFERGRNQKAIEMTDWILAWNPADTGARGLNEEARKNLSEEGARRLHAGKLGVDDNPEKGTTDKWSFRLDNLESYRKAFAALQETVTTQCGGGANVGLAEINLFLKEQTAKLRELEKRGLDDPRLPTYRRGLEESQPVVELFMNLAARMPYERRALDQAVGARGAASRNAPATPSTDSAIRIARRIEVADPDLALFFRYTPRAARTEGLLARAEAYRRAGEPDRERKDVELATVHGERCRELLEYAARLAESARDYRAALRFQADALEARPSVLKFTETPWSPSLVDAILDTLTFGGLRDRKPGRGHWFTIFLTLEWPLLSVIALQGILFLHYARGTFRLFDTVTDGRLRLIATFSLRDPIEFLDLGRKAADEGFDDRAIRYLDRAIRLEPRLLPAYLERGMARYRKGDYEGAAPDLATFVERNPNHKIAHYYQGLAWDKVGKPREAIRSLERALGMDLLEEGVALEDLEKNRYAYQKALERYKSAIKKILNVS